MAKKVSVNYFWNIVCFVALGLFAVRSILGVVNSLGILNISIPFLGLFENITNIIIGIVILISAWNAVAHAKKGWKTAYWIFVILVVISMVLPFIF